LSKLTMEAASCRIIKYEEVEKQRDEFNKHMPIPLPYGSCHDRDDKPQRTSESEKLTDEERARVDAAIAEMEDRE
ncbi:hypothetical protein PMAYCL1PPCAC_04627, partial [Pristionchus mayeri]